MYCNNCKTNALVITPIEYFDSLGNREWGECCYCGYQAKSIEECNETFLKNENEKYKIIED